MSSEQADSGGSFYKGNPTCPRCHSCDTICLEEPWWECAGRVLRDVVPETPAHDPIPIYERCGHRFDVEELAALAEAARREKEARSQEGDRREEKAREITRRLAGVDHPQGILTALGDDGEVDGLIPLASLKGAWMRAVSATEIVGEEEIVTMRGRPATLGLVQRRLPGGTEWGTWREQARLRAVSARWRAITRLPAFDTPSRRLDISLAGSDRRDRIGVDLALDEAGGIWRVEVKTTDGPFVNNMHGSPISRSLIVAAGQDIEIRRRRRHRLCFTEFRNAGEAFPFDGDDSLYCLAMRVALKDLTAGDFSGDAIV